MVASRAHNIYFVLLLRLVVSLSTVVLVVVENDTENFGCKKYDDGCENTVCHKIKDTYLKCCGDY